MTHGDRGKVKAAVKRRIICLGLSSHDVACGPIVGTGPSGRCKSLNSRSSDDRRTSEKAEGRTSAVGLRSAANSHWSPRSCGHQYVSSSAGNGHQRAAFEFLRAVLRCRIYVGRTDRGAGLPSARRLQRRVRDCLREYPLNHAFPNPSSRLGMFPFPARTDRTGFQRDAQKIH